MVFYSHDLKCIRICNYRADGHDLVCPVGFCIDQRKIPHIATSLFSIQKKENNGKRFFLLPV
jgi:hypothetical protein